MFAYFYIPLLNLNLGGLILYRNLEPKITVSLQYFVKNVFLKKSKIKKKARKFLLLILWSMMNYPVCAPHCTTYHPVLDTGNKNNCFFFKKIKKLIFIQKM